MIPASLPPQGCPQAGHWEGEHHIPGIPFPAGPCSAGVGTASSPFCKSLLPQNTLWPQASVLGHGGRPPGTALSPGTVLSPGAPWRVTRGPQSCPQAQVGSSKRRQQRGQSMSSEERTAALTPKQTPPLCPCLPSTVPNPRQPPPQLPCTGWFPMPGPPAHTTARPPGYDPLAWSGIPSPG